jgi:hypothetical protein
LAVGRGRGTDEAVGNCGTDITLVPNLSAFRADIDFLDITISVA